MTCELFVRLQKGYIFMHDLAPCHNSKSTRIFLDCKGIHRKFARHESHRKRLEYNENRDW